MDDTAGYTDFRFSEIGVIQALTRQVKQRIAVMDDVSEKLKKKHREAGAKIE